MSTARHPYEGLTPEVVLAALDSVGMRGDGRLMALNSYENRVYQAWLDDGDPVVLKFYRPARWSDAQILEEHAFIAELAEREVPAVAPLALQPLDPSDAVMVALGDASARVGGADMATLALHAGFRFAVFPRRGGRAPELDAPGVLRRIGTYLGRIHAVGAVRAFSQRPGITLQEFAREPHALLLDGDWIPRELQAPWRAAADMAIERIERAFAQVGALRTLRLHGDCHPGNVLWTDAGAHFVDFDDARTGPAVQDLWMLLSGDAEAMSAQLSEILAGYETFQSFDRRELQLIEPLRTLRLLHYAAWIARRWDDPAFPAAFPWFGSQRYWQDRILELREQIAAMDEPPLQPDR